MHVVPGPDILLHANHRRGIRWPRACSFPRLRAFYRWKRNRADRVNNWSNQCPFVRLRLGIASFLKPCLLQNTIESSWCQVIAWPSGNSYKAWFRRMFVCGFLLSSPGTSCLHQVSRTFTIKPYCQCSARSSYLPSWGRTARDSCGTGNRGSGVRFPRAPWR
jgi:hypothetical protein